MPISVVYYPLARLVRAAGVGTVSRTDVIEFLSEHWVGLDPDWALLLDTRDSVHTYAPTDVLEFVSRTVGVSRARHPHFAIVASDDKRRRSLRQYQLRCEWKGCVTVDVFRTVEDAEAWLALSRP
jgi:hypothetical protein